MTIVLFALLVLALWTGLAFAGASLLGRAIRMSQRPPQDDDEAESPEQRDAALRVRARRNIRLL